MNAVDAVRNENVDSKLEQSLVELCNDAEFKQLETDLKVFNPFRVLKVERYELRHTTTLAWLLNPDESHGMGDAFLKCFLAQVGPGGDERWANAETASAEVLAELVFGKHDGGQAPLVEEAAGAGDQTADRLDVLIEGRSRGGAKWCVAIEAKIDSKEGENQLERYDRWLNRNFSDHKLLKLYLTVQPLLSVESEDGDADGAGPDAPLAPPRPPARWINILWGEHVANALDASKAALADAGLILERRVVEFIEDYRQLVAGLTNGKTNDLDHRVHAFANRSGTSAVLRTLKSCTDAKKVGGRWDTDSAIPTYWQHRALLNMCTTHVRTVEAEFMWEQVLNVIAHDDAWHVLTPITAKTSRVAFLPKSWLGAKGLQNGDNGWNLYYQADFRSGKDDVELKLYLPDTGDRTAQRALLKQLFDDNGQPRPVANCFAPDRKSLLSFMDGAGKSLKLHTVSANWTRREDGSFESDPARNPAKEHKYRAFWTDVDAHTKAILTPA